MDDKNRKPGSPARRWSVRGGVALVVVAALFHLVGGWYFSSKINSGGLTPSAPERNYGVEVVDIDDERVVLTGDDGAIRDPGTYALVWDGGQATVGEVVALPGDNTASRELISITAELPVNPSEVDLDAWMFETPHNAGLQYWDVSYATPLGDMNAWMVPAPSPSTTWAIHVHGWRTDRREAIRSLGAFHEAGVHSLVISYRNDQGAAADPSGRYGFGQTEWPDLEAAVQHALDNGAQRIVLSGFSTGGAIAIAFMTESDLADHVTAIVLDSPNLDFGMVVKSEASRTSLIPGLPIGVPGTLTATAMTIAGLRYGVDWNAINYVDNGEPVDVPVLIFHGDSDQTVPLEVSQRFARANPDQVTLVVTEGASHVRSWNVDADRYDSELNAFLNGE